MIYKEQFKKKRVEKLHFQAMQQLPYFTSLPLIINEENLVLLGNSLQMVLKEKTLFCIVIKSNSFIEKKLLEFEKSLIEIIDNETVFYELEAKIRNYIVFVLRHEKNDFCLFEVKKETDFISEKNYKKPSSTYVGYPGKKKKKGGEVSEDLFGNS